MNSFCPECHFEVPIGAQKCANCLTNFGGRHGASTEIVSDQKQPRTSFDVWVIWMLFWIPNALVVAGAAYFTAAGMANSSNSQIPAMLVAALLGAVVPTWFSVWLMREGRYLLAILCTFLLAPASVGLGLILSNLARP